MPNGCKWVFGMKYNAHGTLEWHKAKLVAKTYGVDYQETFAPRAKMNIMCI